MTSPIERMRLHHEQANHEREEVRNALQHISKWLPEICDPDSDIPPNHLRKILHKADRVSMWPDPQNADFAYLFEGRIPSCMTTESLYGWRYRLGLAFATSGQVTDLFHRDIDEQNGSGRWPHLHCMLQFYDRYSADKIWRIRYGFPRPGIVYDRTQNPTIPDEQIVRTNYFALSPAGWGDPNHDRGLVMKCRNGSWVSKADDLDGIVADPIKSASSFYNEYELGIREKSWGHSCAGIEIFPRSMDPREMYVGRLKLVGRTISNQMNSGIFLPRSIGFAKEKMRLHFT